MEKSKNVEKKIDNRQSHDYKFVISNGILTLSSPPECCQVYECVAAIDNFRISLESTSTKV